MHSSLIGKVEKANRYARELDRITIDRLSLTFRGDNDTHRVALDAGQWRCTCHYFESWGSCVHLLSLQKVFGVALLYSLEPGGCYERAKADARSEDHRQAMGNERALR